MDRPHPPPLWRDDRDAVATQRLNRPSQFNALSEALHDALQRELAVLAGDPHVRTVLLAAEGRAYCAG
ncbi:enoyl-CoA hydratase/isomerase family protein, partial [Burkholderia pseudomallei]